MITLYRFLPTAILLLVFVTDSSAAERSQPLVVAHRGLLQHAPENTLANFRACLELRIGFEFDVQRTNDGHLVCIHDDTVDRTTNGTGNVSQLTLSQIEQLDAGSWFDAKFAQEKVPKVDDVLHLVAEYRQHNILIAVDLKAGGAAQEVVRLAEKHKVLHRLLFIGATISNQSVRRKILAASQQAHVAVVAHNDEEFAVASKSIADSTTHWVYVRYLPSKKQVESARRLKRRVFIAGSTVSGSLRKNWRQAAHVSIDAILTDYPLELLATFREDSQRSKP